MSHIVSPVSDINKLHFHTMPKNKILKGQILRAGLADNTYFVLTEDGKLYCSAVAEGYSYTPSSNIWTISLLKNLVKLKVITKEAVDQHIQYAKEFERKRNFEHLTESLLREANELGITLTKAQKDKLSKLNPNLELKEQKKEKLLNELSSNLL